MSYKAYEVSGVFDFEATHLRLVFGAGIMTVQSVTMKEAEIKVTSSNPPAPVTIMRVGDPSFVTATVTEGGVAIGGDMEVSALFYSRDAGNFCRVTLRKIRRGVFELETSMDGSPVLRYVLLHTQ